MKGLTIYDPRFQDRTLKTGKGKFWSSKENNVLFFETEDYDLYSDSEYVGGLLKILISESKVAKVGLRVSNFKYDLSRVRLERKCLLGNTLVGVVSSSSLSQVLELFNEYADYQTWDFYGLESNLSNLRVLEAFPPNSREQTSFSVYFRDRLGRDAFRIYLSTE